MVVYADIMFAVNFISSYIMLYILGRFINKICIKKIRLIIASTVGGLSSFVFTLDFPWQIIMRVLFAYLMVFISFFELRRHLLNQLIWFMIMCGFMMFTMIMIVSLLSYSTGLEIRGGILYFNLPMKIFLPIFTVSYFVLIFLIKMFKNKQNKKYYIITVTHNDKKITVPALFDSGNLLKEPITGKDVSIVEWKYAKKLFDTDCEFDKLVDEMEKLKLWAVPFHSVGNKNGMILAFIADEIKIHEENKVIKKSFVGLYGDKLSQKGEYYALLNAGLL